MIGGFYLNIAFANYISSLLAVNVTTDPMTYGLVYKYISFSSIFVCLLLLVFLIYLNKNNLFYKIFSTRDKK